MDNYNDLNHMSGQQMPDSTSGQIPELYMTEQIPEMRGHYPSGHTPYVQQLRRPNVVMTSSTADSVNDLAKQTGMMSLGSNEANYNSIGGAGDMPNTGSWMASEPKASSPGGSSMASNLSPFAKEFVPRAPMSYPSAPPVANGGSGWRQMPVNDNREFDDFIALSYLREFIDTITIKPNKYDSGINYLTDVLNTYMDEDETVMDSVVNIIVDQAIVEPQFRYNGVRLCIHLIEKLNILSDDKDFKKLLIRRCQREYSRRDNLIRSNAEYFRGLTLFIGDLYSRMGSEEMAQILPQLLLTLFSKPEKENLKCICQVLKLCGAFLENYFNNKTNESNDFSKVMKQLSVCSEDKTISPYVKELMTNIIEMQKRGWTANMPSTATTSNQMVNPYANQPNPTNNWNNGGEYYEEYNNYSDDDEFLHQASYDFGQCGDEDDNEVCEAFEEFLKNSGQTK